MKNYQYNCVHAGSIQELDHIIAHAEEISYRTFIKNVDKDFVESFNKEVGIPIHKDFAVRFYKSKTPEGEIVYFFEHSAIEYVFY